MNKYTHQTRMSCRWQTAHANWFTYHLWVVHHGILQPALPCRDISLRGSVCRKGAQWQRALVLLLEVPYLPLPTWKTLVPAGFFCENDLKIEVAITDAEIDRKVKLQIQPCGIMNWYLSTIFTPRTHLDFSFQLGILRNETGWLFTRDSLTTSLSIPRW